jgi:virginiamycin B lyase
MVSRWSGFLRLAVGVAGLCSATVHAQNASAPPPRPIAELPFDRLEPDAVVMLALNPGAAAAADAIWVPQQQPPGLVRIDPTNNMAGTAIPLPSAPCTSQAVAVLGSPASGGPRSSSGETSVWVALCEANTMVRIAAASATISASMPLLVSSSTGSAAAAAGSLWVISDPKGVLSRVDPDTHDVVAEAYVAGRPFAVAAADEVLWVTSWEGDLLTRIDARTNLIVETLKVGPRPGRVVVGEGAVWTLNRGDGSVSRVDPTTNKVVATIAVGESVADGELAVGEGSVWISAPGVPLVRIDPRSDRVVQRFTGEAGGGVLVAHGAVWVAAGPSLTWRLDPKLVAAMRPD